MSINDLPIHILEHIFSYLDNQSMKNAMRVCELWEDIFGNSKNLMNKFVFEMFDFDDDEHFPNIPLKNVNIGWRGIRLYAKHIVNALKNYRTTVETLKISDCCIETEVLSYIINAVDNLKVLNLDNILIYPSETWDYDIRFNLPSLKCLSIYTKLYDRYYDYRDEIWPIIFTLFEKNESIEKLSFEIKEIFDEFVDSKKLSVFIDTLPNLKHLIFKTNGYGLIDSSFGMNMKLEKLEIDSLNDYEDLMEFLLNQKDSLKELKLLQTCDEAREDEEEKVLIKFILDKLKLQTFYNINEAIILNGKIQEDAVSRFLTSE